MLSLEEFGDRAGLVFAADGHDDLDTALGDPSWRTIPAIVPGRSMAPATTQRSKSRWHVALFGSNERNGRWRLPEHNVALAMFGGTTLDLREVTLEDPDAREVTITAIAIFGGCDIFVPEGMEVDVTGIAIFGGKDVKVSDAHPVPGLPVLRVRTFALFGGCEVRSRKSRVEERREKEERRARRRDRHQRRYRDHDLPDE